MKSKLDWKAHRNGSFYCSPACGGRCTWEAYERAEKKCAALVKFLGPGWEVRIHENLGWHYSAVNKAKRLYVSQHAGRYMAILGGHWVGHDTSPILAIRSAFLIAKPELENLKAILAVIEEGI